MLATPISLLASQRGCTKTVRGFAGTDDRNKIIGETGGAGKGIFAGGRRLIAVSEDSRA